jgi:ankyrin repeat protein
MFHKALTNRLSYLVSHGFIPEMEGYIYYFPSLLKEPDEKGNIPLINAIRRNDPKIITKIIKEMIEKKIDINMISTENQETPLSFAMFWRYTHSIYQLIEAGADPTIPDPFGETPIELALMRRPEFFHTLLRSEKARLKILDDYGNSLFAKAMQDFLVRRSSFSGTDTNYVFSVNEESLLKMTLLLDYGVRLKEDQIEGFLKCPKRFYSISNVFICYNYIIEQLEKFPRFFSDSFKEKLKEEQEEKEKIVDEENFRKKLNSLTTYCQYLYERVLDRATKNCFPVVVSKIIATYIPDSIMTFVQGDWRGLVPRDEEKISINTHDQKGNTVLIHAARNGDEGMCSVLLEDPEINLNACNDLGDTALISVLSNISKQTQEEREKIALKLIEAKAHINLFNKNENTALICAAYYGCSLVIDQLILQGATLNVLSLKGRTALYLLFLRNHKEIATRIYINEHQKQLDNLLVHIPPNLLFLITEYVDIDEVLFFDIPKAFALEVDYFRERLSATPYSTLYLENGERRSLSQLNVTFFKDKKVIPAVLLSKPEYSKQQFRPTGS